jgi:hypothetical protein
MSQSQTINIRGAKGGFSAFRPPPATTEKRGFGGPLMSLLFHAALIAGTYVTWQHVLAPAEETHAVPVELVTIAPSTNIAAEAPPPEKIEIPKPSLQAPPLPDFAQAEPAPEPPIPQFKILPEKSQTETQDTEKKPSAQDFSALLNKLTQAQNPDKAAKTGPRAVTGIGNPNLATATLVDALISQIKPCWNVGAVAGAPHPSDLVVSFDLKLNRNGTVAGLQLLPESIARATVNPYTKAAVEAASRAIYACQGQGFRLPPDRYNEWSEINPLNFDPRQMMGQ